MTLLLATRNHHKVEEIRRILADVPGLEILGLEEAGVAYDPAEEGIEPYQTFEENARSKARYYRSASGLATVADDSGIEVDFLDGAPGVRSKRFSGRTDLEGQALDRANNETLLERLRGLPPERRTARYVCVAALDEGPPGVVDFRGTLEGVLLEAPRGSGGFGYDPLFFVPPLGKTFAEITREEKNVHSHRGRAFRALAAFLRERGR